MKSFNLRAKFATLFYAVSLGVMLMVGWFGYQNTKEAYTKAALDLAAGYTTEVSTRIQDFLQLSHSDLDFISNNYAILHHAYWMDIGEEEKREQYHKIATDTLRGFAESYPYNYKIRIINADGHEHIKIVRNQLTDQVEITAEKDLQNVQNKDFFSQVIKMSAHDVFVSTLELEVENGKIVTPHIPLIRSATPLIGQNKFVYGVVEVTVLADKLFNYIRNAISNEQGRTFYLVAPNGDYLFHPDSSKSFGTQLKTYYNFEQDFPQLLAQMQQQPDGVLFSHNALITYRTIYPGAHNKQNYWLLVGMVPESIALADLVRFEYTFVGLLLLVIVSVFFASRYFLNSLMAPLYFVTDQLKALGRGEVKLENFEYRSQDELHDMLESTRRLIMNMEHLALQADAVGKGDFSGQVEVLSEQDRLGYAINNMTRMLQTANQADQERNWLRDGLEQLSAALTGDLDSAQLADIAISVLGRYVQAGRGVFYVYNSSEKSLELLGSYMYSERNQVGSRFKLGEGAVGQVAREKKPIFLTVLSSEQPPIVTGTSAGTPLYTYTYPLLREDVLLGVLELASFSAFSDLKLALLQKAVDISASFLYIVQQREQIKNLLVIAEKAEQEARSQSVRLQETNALMEEQQQQLQQQTEELQETNAQMEEQQQLLQQQAEELQQTNAQMEETQQQLAQQNHRLVESQQELDARAKQLELSSQYKSEFLANMSHELRTPLNSIILLSKMLAANNDNHLNADEVHHSEIIHNAGQELLRLINDVLDLSKIEAGRMELHPATISSQDLLTELHSLFEHTAKEKNLEFKLEDLLHGEFISDMNRLSQIVRNLLSNAFKFTKTGGVTLLIERRADAHLPIRIMVKDTGIGIAADKRQLIFEAFAQADGSISRQYGGTGLGLSISLRFAQLLGGTIELNSTPDVGSEFSLLLPENLPDFTETTLTVASKPAAPISVESTPAEQPAPPKPSSPAPTFIPLSTTDDREQLSEQDSIVLLIDDDPLFGQALLEINRRLGYKTLLALTGKEGMELALRYKPNGILLDLGLPDMDGTQVLHQLKIQPDVADIPVYVVSGREKDAALMQQGLLGYLQKPVDVQQISQAEAELLAFIHKKASGQTILVLENGCITAEQISRLVDPEVASVLKVMPDSDLTALLSQTQCCLAIIDFNGQSVQQALNSAKKLQALEPQLNFVFFGCQTLDDEEEALLRQYSDSIIIKTPQSEQRLLQNIERFLAKAARTDASESTPTQKTASGNRLQGRHILVVDDDARNLFVITAALEKEGAKVSGVLNGKRALEFLQKHSVDLVFMDIMMPEMDGYQTVIKLRSNPAIAKIPVVVLTAKALSSDREKALAAGADDYLAKPADYDALINMAVVWCTGRH